MSHQQIIKLSHFTKLLLLFLIVYSIKADCDNAGILATVIWLELGLVVKYERRVIEWFISKFS